MLYNPFIIYCLTFGGGLAVYELGWSEIMPHLSWCLLAFFTVTFAAAIVLSRLTRPLLTGLSYTPGILPRCSLMFVVGTVLIEFWLNGVNMLRIMSGENFYEIEATATHLHVFVVWSVFCIIRFADFVYSPEWKRMRKWLYLAEALIPIAAYTVMVYRGPALILILSCGFVLITRYRRVMIWLPPLAIAALLALYANGRLGNFRSPGQATVIGQPSAEFMDSGIPLAYFWTYLYVTVPIGNLQLSVNELHPPQGTVPEFIVTELIPDTFSKRIMPYLDGSVHSASGPFMSRDQLYSWKQPRVGHGMNISTIFGRAYGYFGWTGPAIMFVALSVFIAAYLYIIRWSPYRIPCLVLLNTLVVFCLFNNMLASAAMIPLLIIPLLLPPWGWLLTLWRSRGGIGLHWPEAHQEQR